MNAPVARNAPCPCGSGRRYKDCHGKLEAQSPDAPQAVLARALASHQRGALDEAERGYRQLLAGDPGHAAATHYLAMIAWQRGDPAAAEPGLRRSIDLDPRVADFHNNLGLLLRDTGRAPEAVAAFERAIALEPGWSDAYGNLGLAHEEMSDWQPARRAFEAAVERAPQGAVAHQNLARVLLALGEFGDGWKHYRWRLRAQGLARAEPDREARPLPRPLEGRRFALLGEQGIGDVLFFLRFAPTLAQRGAALAFRGDARLRRMLERTGLFIGGVADERTPPPAGHEPVFVGDLPWLLGATDAASLPPPLALAPDPAMAPSPPGAGAVALTWRGGAASQGPARTRLKQVALERLAALARPRGTRFVSIQRLPRAGEREALERALGAPVEDGSALNQDLETMLAFLAQARDYVGVSNANTHLRAGLGKPAVVLVPSPAEWRWMASGERSPWFPGVEVIRL